MRRALALALLGSAGALFASGPVAADEAASAGGPAAPEGETSDAFSSASLRRFARDLRERGDWTRAAAEYHRHALLHRAGADTAWFSAGACLERGGRTERAEGYYRELLSRFPTSPLVPEARYRTALDLRRRGEIAASDSAARAGMTIEDDPARRNDLAWLLACNRVEAADWNGARAAFAAGATSPAGPDSGRWSRGLALAEGWPARPSKSPAVARALSAILPGAGKAYCGLAGDALVSLAFVGLTGALSASGFHDDGTESIQGWSFAVIGAGLHLGNVYGSGIAAGTVNRTLEEEYLATFDPGLDSEPEIPF